jgi:hypothetical protein
MSAGDSLRSCLISVSDCFSQAGWLCAAMWGGVL